jgi:hypothetical protein
VLPGAKPTTSRRADVSIALDGGASVARPSTPMTPASPVNRPLVEPISIQTGFDPPIHGFHFDNDFENRYELPFVGKTITTYGRCGGMTYAALDLFLAQQPTPATTELPADNTPLARYLLDRLVDSWVSPSAMRFVAWSTRDDAWVHEMTGSEIDVLVAALQAGQPVPLGMISAASRADVSNNHQVLAYAVERDANGVARISIYDNNTHDQRVTLTWDPNVIGVTATNRDHPWRGLFVHTYNAQTPPPDLSS